jgi:hypothetical protein
LSEFPLTPPRDLEQTLSFLCTYGESKAYIRRETHVAEAGLVAVSDYLSPLGGKSNRQRVVGRRLRKTAVCVRPRGGQGGGRVPATLGKTGCCAVGIDRKNTLFVLLMRKNISCACGGVRNNILPPSAIQYSKGELGEFPLALILGAAVFPFRKVCLWEEERGEPSVHSAKCEKSRITF